MHWHPSPNFDERASEIDMLVVHYTDMPDAKTALARLCDANSKVSAHYLIDRDATLYHLVKEEHRAWHAGVSYWQGARDINSCSIGIELQNKGDEPYPPAQMQAFIALAKTLIARWQIAPARVLGHSDIAPYRKQDPGALFDWRACAEQGVGLFVSAPPTTSLAPDEIKDRLAHIGYELRDDDLPTLIAAFQRHHRAHKIDGVADSETQSLIDALARAQ